MLTKCLVGNRFMLVSARLVVSSLTLQVFTHAWTSHFNAFIATLHQQSCHIELHINHSKSGYQMRHDHGKHIVRRTSRVSAKPL
ncbi:hypothetical protein K456DRAFT_49865 [Colletotrichum gloeosporioides 23]|nr:hypothetical protein K456DRAFT_49865 [Colletotrichum gloeosporioides 23]